MDPSDLAAIPSTLAVAPASDQPDQWGHCPCVAVDRPPGLAAVITLTLLITASRSVTGLGGGVLQRWLEGAERQPGHSGAGGSTRRSLNPGTWRLPRR